MQSRVLEKYHISLMEYHILDLLMNDEYRTTCIQNTLNDPAFKESMKRYDEAGKMNILKMSGRSAIRLLGNHAEAAHREAQAENAPVQPQVHN